MLPSVNSPSSTSTVSGTQYSIFLTTISLRKFIDFPFGGGDARKEGSGQEIKKKRAGASRGWKRRLRMTIARRMGSGLQRRKRYERRKEGKRSNEKLLPPSPSYYPVAISYKEARRYVRGALYTRQKPTWIYISARFVLLYRWRYLAAAAVRQQRLLRQGVGELKDVNRVLRSLVLALLRNYVRGE